MSRPSSQIRLGFFPCPLEVIDQICQHIEPHPEMVVCDPCAGEGAAISRLSQQLGVAGDRIVAAELDIDRSRVLLEALPESHVTGNVDFLSASYSAGSVSLLYLNPPFDSELGFATRLEAMFLSRGSSVLAPGGILVYVVPRIRVSAGALRKMLYNQYEQVESFDFPKELRKYDECVVIAYKRRRAIHDEFTSWSFLKKPGVVSKYKARAGRVFSFRKQEYTDQELLRLLNFDRAVESLLGNNREAKRLRPPLELGDGHKALLLAAGYLNGRIAKPGCPPHVVRGTSRKVERVKEETRDSKHLTQVIEERIELLIRKVDSRGIIEDITDAEPSQ